MIGEKAPSLHYRPQNQINMRQLRQDICVRHHLCSLQVWRSPVFSATLPQAPVERASEEAE